MLLLVKNAHYFNETGSEIYKVCLDKDTSVLACKYDECHTAAVILARLNHYYSRSFLYSEQNNLFCE